VTADTISYVEAHGTGTLLGDPIEIAALVEAFRETSKKSQYCAIGSVKTNLGHLDAAAGVTGLIKTVLQLQHKQLVPSLHYAEPNPKIDFANSPFYVNAKLQEWKSEGGPRRAGVSSFGIGGTNAHVVLEEAPEREPSGGSRRLQLLSLSAKTSTALEAATANLEEHLKRNAEEKLADVAYTQAVGRTGYKHRRAVVGETREEALAALGGEAGQRIFHGVAEGERGVAFLFPGQGTQYVGMGRSLYESEEVYRREVERCAEELRGKLGVDLREVLYPQEGEEEKAKKELKQTRLTQPALFTVEWGLTELWRSWGVEPEGMAGHSVGEYVAATVAGVMELEEALEVVAERGRLMQQAERGAMLSVPLEEGEVRGLVGEGLWIAAVNGPGLTVVSGREERIAEFEERLREQGVEGRRLETSHAFHSGMMDVVLEEFRRVIERVQLKAPGKRYLSNVSGTWIKEEEARDANYWVRQLRETVRFGENVKELLGDGERVLLEVGPGNVLGGLARRQGAREVYGSLRDGQEGGREEGRITRTLGRMWVAGVKVDWEGYYRGEKRHRVVLPTYPFERQRYWVEAGSAKAAPTASAATPLKKKTDVADWFYVPSWKRSAPPELYRSDKTSRRFLIFNDECGLGSALAAHLTKNGHQVTTVTPSDQFATLDASTYTIRPDCADHYHDLLKLLRQSNRLPSKVIHLWTVTWKNPAPEEVKQQGFYSLLFLAQAIGDQAHTHSLEIDVVSNGLQEVSGEEENCPDKATVLGPTKVIPQEFTNIGCRSIDVLFPSPGESVVENLAAEVLGNSTDTVVAYRGLHRWVETVAAVRLEAKASGSTRLRKQGVYLITGGVGGIGLVLAEHLAKTCQAKLVLTARTALPPRENWHEWLTAHDELDSISGKIRKLESLEQRGAECLVLTADVSSKVQMQDAIREAYRRFGTIHGVIHAAGIASGGLAQVKTREVADRVLAPKLKGTPILASLLRDLDFFLLCSSITAIRGAVGQVDYCSANSYLDAFARSGQIPNCISINWDAWQEVGMAVDTKMPADLLERRKRELEATGISPNEGVDAFDRVIRTGLRQVIVCTRSLLPSSAETVAVDAAVAETTLPRSEATLHPRPVLQSNYAAPRNDIDVAIAEIWQKLLGIEQVGIHDNFFELGGHSLLATQVVSRLRDSLKVDLPLRTLFEATTIADLSDKISSNQISARNDVGAILEELEQLSEEDAQQLLSAEVEARAIGKSSAA
jgi:acyl transferase domain-containing protein/acyl carrier protein